MSARQKGSKQDLGKLGEIFAVKLLKANNYKIIDRNFRTKFGEIDVVAIDNDTLCFVEVKTRWGRKYGSPEEAVTFRKIARIKKAASLYIKKYTNLPKKYRIDVVAIEIENGKVASAKIIQMD